MRKAAGEKNVSFATCDSMEHSMHAKRLELMLFFSFCHLALALAF